MSAAPSIPISKRTVVVNSASFVLARVLNLSILVWLYQYLIARIPAQEFAIYPVVAAVMVFAPLFFSTFTGGILRHVVDAYARGDGEGVRRVVSSIVPAILAMTGVFLAAGFAFALGIDHVLNIPPALTGEAQLMMGLLVLVFAFQMVVLPFATGFHVRQRYVELNLLLLGRELVRLGVLLTLLTLYGAAVLWIVVATVVAETLYGVFSVWRSRRLVPELAFSPRLFDRAQMRELVSFGAWTTIGQLGIIMYTHAATIVLNLFGTDVDVLVYFVAATLFRQLEVMIFTAIAPLRTVLTAMQATGSIERIANTMQRGARFALWLSLAVAVPMIVFAADFVRLYMGPDYTSQSLVFVLLMLIFPFNQATILLPMTCVALARVREFFLPAFLFQAAGLAIMLVTAGVFDMGAVGVTLGLCLITVASQFFYYWRLSIVVSQTSLRWFVRRILVPGWLPALAALPVWIVCGAVMPTQTWLQLGLAGAGGGVVYVAVLLAFGLERDEKAILAAALGRLRDRLLPGARGGARAALAGEPSA